MVQIKVYNLGNRIMNTYLYPIANGYVMIDTGYENSYDNFYRNLSKNNIDLEDIKYLFLTHAHDDHAGFLNELLNKAPHIKVIINSKSIPVLRRGQNSFEGGCSGMLAYFFCQILKILGKGDHRFPTIDDKNKGNFIEISEENIAELEKTLEGKIISSPGHTKDSMSLIVEGGQTFCGDAAMNDFPSSNRIVIWIEDLKAYENSWEKFIDQGVKYLYPSHGRPFPIEDLEENIDEIKDRKLYSLS